MAITNACLPDWWPSDKPWIIADCLEVMRGMPDKCVDLVLTDPPYGIGIDGSKESIQHGVQIRKGYDFKGWDKSIPSKEIFDEIERIAKHKIICGANYFNQYLEQGHKGWMVWYKMQTGLTMSDCEIIYSDYDTPTRIFECHRSTLWQENPQHPTQKPVSLFEWILNNHPNEKTVFDPFLGSGTTLLACRKTGRIGLGCEINPEYEEIIKKRSMSNVSKLDYFSSISKEVK